MDGPRSWSSPSRTAPHSQATGAGGGYRDAIHAARSRPCLSNCGPIVDLGPRSRVEPACPQLRIEDWRSDLTSAIRTGPWQRGDEREPPMGSTAPILSEGHGPEHAQRPTALAAVAGNAEWSSAQGRWDGEHLPEALGRAYEIRAQHCCCDDRFELKLGCPWSLWWMTSLGRRLANSHLHRIQHPVRRRRWFAIAQPTILRPPGVEHDGEIEKNPAIVGT